MSRLKSVKLRFVRVFLTFSSFLISCCSPALPERIMWPTRVFSLFQIYQNQLCTQKKKSLQLMIWLCNSLWCCFTFRRLHFPGPLRTRCLHHMKFVLFFGIKCKCFKLSFVNETVSFFLFSFFVLMVYFGVKPLSHTSAGQELQSESVFSARISRSVETVVFKHTWMSGDALVFVFCIQGIKVMPLGWKKTAVCTVL